MQTETDADDKTAIVSEDKFDGTATLVVEVDAGANKREVKRLARQFFRDTHGTDPSKIIAEKDMRLAGEQEAWDVMVADHSSGSLVNSQQYDL